MVISPIIRFKNQACLGLTSAHLMSSSIHLIIYYDFRIIYQLPAVRNRDSYLKYLAIFSNDLNLIAYLQKYLTSQIYNILHLQIII
jgi:hypothetical protein